MLCRGGCYGALAARLGQDKEKWKTAGLLHELEIEIINNDLDRHGFETEKTLKEKGVDAEIIDAIVMHNERASGKNETLYFSMHLHQHHADNK